MLKHSEKRLYIFFLFLKILTEIISFLFKKYNRKSFFIFIFWYNVINFLAENYFLKKKSAGLPRALKTQKKCGKIKQQSHRFFLKKRPYRITASTRDSHSWNRSSILRRVTHSWEFKWLFGVIKTSN